MGEPLSSSHQRDSQPGSLPATGGEGAPLPYPAGTGLARLLTCVFEGWNRAGIPFVILRNYENLPAATSNDVDVLVEPSRLKEAEQVSIGAAKTAGYRLHNRIEFASLGLFFYEPQALQQIQVDLYPELAWRGFTVLRADAVIAERVDSGLFAIPHPVHEACISLLGRLLQHGEVAEKYKPQILAGFRSEVEKAKRVLSEPFGIALSDGLVNRVLAENWAGVADLARPLRRALMFRALTRHPLATAAVLIRAGLRILRRWFRPGGMVLVILGADGSGKSTVAAQLIERLRPTFPPGKGLQVHWKPVVFFRQRRQPSGKPNIDPHGQPARGLLASVCYLTGHWLEYLLGSLLQFRPAMFRGGLVLIDRYYYDFLIDQRRYRLSVPNVLVRVLFRALRQPDLVFLLDAPANVLQARKREVSPAETERQIQAYRQLVASLPQGYTFDATAYPDRVTAELTRQLLDWLAARTQNR